MTLCADFPYKSNKKIQERSEDHYPASWFENTVQGYRKAGTWLPWFPDKFDYCQKNKMTAMPNKSNYGVQNPIKPCFSYLILTVLFVKSTKKASLQFLKVIKHPHTDCAALCLKCCVKTKQAKHNLRQLNSNEVNGL